MKCINHMFAGTAVGVVQYLLITGTSYLAVKVNDGTLVLGLSCFWVIAITMLNILYKTDGISSVLLRVAFSVLSYLLVMFVCAYSGLAIKLEEHLAIGNNGQLLQGMGTVFLVASSIIVGAFAIGFKCIVLYCRWRKG